MKKLTNWKKIGILGFTVAAVATVYAVRNRKTIKEKVEGAKERSALALHKRIGMPVYTYLKKMHGLPF